MRNKLDTNRTADLDVAFEPLNPERVTAAAFLLRVAIVIASLQSDDELPVIV